MSKNNIVLVPVSSPNDQFALVTRLAVAEGEAIKEGQLLVELETTKTQVEVVSSADGFVHFLVQEGDQVEVNSVLAIVSESKQSSQNPIPDNKKITRKAQKLMRDHHLGPDLFEGMDSITSQDVLKKIVSSPAKEAIKLPQTFTKQNEISHLLQATANSFASDVTVLFNEEKVLKTIAQKTSGHFYLSVGDFLAYQCCLLLQKHPYFNAWYDGIAFAYQNVNLGMALNISGKGLKVVTIRDVPGLTLEKFAGKMQELIAGYLRDELKVDELTGSSFTLSNMHSTGVRSFTPLINLQQGAILGISSSVGGDFEVKLRFDHRLADGLIAASFLAELKQVVES